MRYLICFLINSNVHKHSIMYFNLYSTTNSKYEVRKLVQRPKALGLDACSWSGIRHREVWSIPNEKRMEKMSKSFKLYHRDEESSREEG
jgi:hypothetical protein